MATNVSTPRRAAPRNQAATPVQSQKIGDQPTPAPAERPATPEPTTVENVPATATEKNLVSLLAGLGDWARVITAPALHSAEELQAALDAVKAPLLAACWPDLFRLGKEDGKPDGPDMLFPIDGAHEYRVELVILNDGAPTSGKLDGRALVLFADTVAQTDLTIYNGHLPAHGHPKHAEYFRVRKGRVVQVEGQGFFALSPVPPRTPRTALLFRLV